MDRKKVGNSYEYLIKWKEFKDPSWEKRADLVGDIKRLVDNFDKKLDKKEKEKTFHEKFEIIPEEKYEVEKLIDKRKVGRSIEYNG